MLKHRDINFVLFLLTFDLLLTDLALFAASFMRMQLAWGRDLGIESPGSAVPLIAYVIVPAIWALVFVTVGVYDSRRTFRAADDFQAVLTAIGVATLVFAGAAYFLFRDLSRLLFGYFFILDVVTLILWRVILRTLFRLTRGGWPFAAERAIIVGAGSVGQRIAQTLIDLGWTGVEIIGFLDDDLTKAASLADSVPMLGTLDDVDKIITERGVAEVIVALPMRAHIRLVEFVSGLQSLPVRVHVVPDLFDLAFFRTTIDEVAGVPMIGLREPVIGDFERAVKRVFDVSVAGLSLVVAIVPMGIIALAIKLDSPGPVIFKQQRIGENGKLFRMYKFRSMYPDPDRCQGEEVFQADDGRIVAKTTQ